MSRAEDIAAKAYDTGLQVGVTLAGYDQHPVDHPYLDMGRDQWLEARREMALKAALKEPTISNGPALAACALLILAACLVSRWCGA
jgi:hypothetical protein